MVKIKGDQGVPLLLAGHQGTRLVVERGEKLLRGHTIGHLKRAEPRDSVDQPGHHFGIL